jgi:plastocyanin
MRGRVVAGLAALAALAAVAPSAASAYTQNVAIQSGAFDPPALLVLAGDTVAWHNASFRNHTVTARDGSFGSPGQIGTGGGYSFTFSSSGSFAYYCQVHPFMTGVVAVFPVLLSGPKEAVNRGGQVELDGRAEPGTSAVDIQRDDGAGFLTVATAAVDGAGAFRVSLPAAASARYRAVAAAGSSPDVQVVVVDRSLAVRAARHGRSELVRVRAVPSDPGAIVMLQIQLRERFGWWPVARKRLDRHSAASFRAPVGARVRAVLTLADGWTPVTTSPPLRLR